MIPLFKPYVSDKARELALEVLSGTQLAEGQKVKDFEAKFAETFGFEPWQCVSLNSGTSALELAYEICGIGQDWEKRDHRQQDEVITPVLTCTATNIPLVRRHAKIVFGDIDGITNLNISPDDIQRKITSNTRAIVFVSFGGNGDGLERVQSIAREAGLDLIVDAAQALGGTLPDSARFTCVSLQAIKSLTAGDGGVLICERREDAVLARKLRWFGYDRELKQRVGDCDLELAGYKMHMNDISAAIGLGNLEDWPMIVAHRRAINAAYRARGEGKGFIEGIWNPQVVGMEYEPMRAKLEAAGVQIGQYHYPNSKYSVFRGATGACPVMESLKDSYFMLPCHLGMEVEDAERIASLVWP